MIYQLKIFDCTFVIPFPTDPLLTLSYNAQTGLYLPVTLQLHTLFQWVREAIITSLLRQTTSYWRNNDIIVANFSVGIFVSELIKNVNTVEPLWKGHESLTNIAKVGPFPRIILYKSCLIYPSWQATAFERPLSWMAFIERFHCTSYCFQKITVHLKG